ncbi:MAG: DUF1127 domain-containing protein [Hyphomicrobiales bacterium]
MRTSIPVSTTANVPVVQAFFVLGAFILRGIKQFARALKHRRDTTVLARMDERMLADIGLTRADLQDAISVMPWNDPTALLRTRALERRLARHGISLGLTAQTDSAFKAPPTDRPARLSV